MNQSRILQPGQVNLEFEHGLPPDFQPAAGIAIRVGEHKTLVVGGMTVREEIAARMLAGMAFSDSISDHTPEEIAGLSLRYADALLAKTRPSTKNEIAE